MSVALALGAGLLAACSNNADVSGSTPEPGGLPDSSAAPVPSATPVPGTTGTPTPPPDATGTPRLAGTVARGLEAPWGLAFLPGGDALVAERDTARVKRVAPGGRVTVVGSVPGVDPRGEGGLLGLAVSPTFAADHLVYAYFTGETDNRIVRMTYLEDRLGRPQTVVTGIPKGNIHNGGRLAFGPDRMLYAGTGESGKRGLSQDRSSLGGKILRMTPEGRPAPGNPFGDSLVFSYGHRNVQGLAFDSSGRLWASEFGQNTWDELNLVRPGRNYGWPVVEGKGDRPGYVDPVAQWDTRDASPSGLAVAGNAVYMAGLRGARLWRIPLRDDGVQTTPAGPPRAYFTRELGRLRTVVLAPDGSLWLTTSNTDGRGDPRGGDDRIVRVAL